MAKIFVVTKPAVDLTDFHGAYLFARKTQQEAEAVLKKKYPKLQLNNPNAARRLWWSYSTGDYKCPEVYIHKDNI